LAGIRSPGRVRVVLQLPDGFRLRGRVVQKMFRRVVLLRGHRAGQPKPGPVHGADVHHVLRATTQGGRSGRHGARAGVHPGNGPGRGHAAVTGRQVLLGRSDRRVLCLPLAVHGRPAGRCGDYVLRQCHGPDSPVQLDHVPILRARSQLCLHQPAAGGVRGPSVGRLRGPVS